MEALNDLERKQKEPFTIASRSKVSAESLKACFKPATYTSSNPAFKPPSTSFTYDCGMFNHSSTCLKCLILRRIWMFSINMYDFMGLLDICPCGTLHPIRPYISYKIKCE